MSKTKAIIFIAVILIRQNYAQTKEYADTAKSDSTKQRTISNFKYFNSDDLYKSRNLYKYYYKEPGLIIPYNNLSNNDTLFLKPYLSLNLISRLSRPNKIDQFKFFTNSLYNLLAMEYKERKKYDLGVVGKYLGISKTIAAIILAILSLF